MGHSSLTLYVAALPVRLRPGARRPRGAAHLGLADPGPPRGAPHPGRRDDDRPARPGRRQRRRHGDGRPPRARPVRPRHRRGREPVRPHDLVLRLRRRPRGGRQRRGVARSPAPSSSATWSSSTTTTTSPSRTTPNVAFTEDVGKRYEAYGWHVAARRHDGEDLAAVDAALAAAQGRDRPAVVHRAAHDHRLAGAEQAEHRQAAHGSALGEDEVAATKEILGFDPEQDLRRRRRGHRAHPQGRRPRPGGARRLAAGASTPGQQRNPDGAALLDRLVDPHAARGLGRRAAQPGTPTRRASPPARPPARCSPRSCPVLPELWGGSADLAESNNTDDRRASRRSCRPTGRPRCGRGGPYGRTLHFGIREHAMGAIMNGIALHGGTRAYGGTFLMFSDYMRGAVRLAALMQLPVTYVWTHDSIGLGEDGPTHQPIEHSPRCGPSPAWTSSGPADANETAVAWRTILEHTDRPGRPRACPGRTCRSSTAASYGSAEGVARGGYVLAEASGGTPEVILMGTGSEVQIAVAAREPLEADGIADPGRLDAVPWSGSPTQDQAYRDEVLPAGGPRPGERRGRRRPWAGASSSATPAGSSASTTTAPAPPTPCSTRSSASPPRPSSPPPARASRPPRPAPVQPQAAATTGALRTPPATADRDARLRDHCDHTERHRHGTEREPGRAVRRGVAVWLDDLSRDRIRSGNLQSLVDEYSVVGVTTNPTIFAAAISGSDSYDDQVHALAVREGRASRRRCAPSPPPTSATPATCSARSHDRQPGDGRVSLEVGPRPGARHRRDHRRGRRTCGGWSTGRTCSSRSRRPRPACRRSPRPSPTGISVNVTLIFSLERYRGGHGRLPRRPGEAAWPTAARPRRHRARWPRSSSPGSTPRSTSAWTRLGADAVAARARPASPTRSWPTRPTRRSSPPTAGARSRRRAPRRSGRCGPRPASRTPSTATRCTSASSIAPGTVNTMPEKTMLAYADHGTPGTPVQKSYDDAAAVMKAVADAGVDLDDVFRVLEDEGVQKFVDSWDELTDIGGAASSRSKALSRVATPACSRRPEGRPVHRRAGRRALPPTSRTDHDPQPAARSAGPAAAPGAAALRAGRLRHHRRPGAQEAAARGLRPGQPRAAADQLRAARLRPPRLGRHRVRRARPARPPASTPAPRGARRCGSSWPPTSRSSRARSTTTTPSTSWPPPSASWRAATASAATPRSTSPSRRRCSRPCSSRCSAPGMAESTRRPLAAGRRREAVRRGPALQPGAQRAGRLGVQRRRRLPHRPLPGQGDRPEPAGAAVRQHPVRADLERPPRRLGADHHGRGRRHRRPGRSSTRRPAPPGTCCRTTCCSCSP